MVRLLLHGSRRQLSRQSRVSAHVRSNAKWNTSLSSNIVTGLLRDGYFVVHNAFPVEYLCHLRDEIHQLHTRGQLYPNSTHVLLKTNATDKTRQTKTLLLEKHDILETEMAFNNHISGPFLRDFFEQQVVYHPLHQAMPEWLGLIGHMVKVQYNGGQGACFPMHFDTYGDDGKCVTAVLYLNEEWKRQDGGEIVLFPFPKSPVVIQPRFGTIVFFSSQHMLHRVMPAFKPRYALTTWLYHSPPLNAKEKSHVYYQSNANDTMPKSMEEKMQFQTMMRKILRSSFRRHFLKLVYEKEWIQSLYDSHLPSDAFHQYMETHRHEVRVIEAATTKMLGNFRAKDRDKDSTLPQTKEELMQQMMDESHQEFLQHLQLHWF